MSDHAQDSQKKQSRLAVDWLSAMTGIVLFIVVVVIWHATALLDHERMLNKVRSESEHLTALIENDMQNRASSLQRMIIASSLRSGMSMDELCAITRLYISGEAGIVSVAWADRGSSIHQTLLSGQQEKNIKAMVSSEKKWNATLLTSRHSGSPQLFFPRERAQGVKELIIVFPVFISDEFRGHILLACNTSDFFALFFGFEYSKKPLRSVLFSAFVKGESIYEQKGWSDLGKNGVGVVSTAHIMNYDMAIETRPTAAFVENNSSSMPRAILILGGLLSALAAFAVRQQQQGYVKFVREQAARRDLENEVNERKSAEYNLKRALFRMELATQSAQMGVWTWDLLTNSMTWDARAFELFDIPPDVMPVYETWRSAIHPDDVPRVEALEEEAIIGKAPFNTDYRVIHNDGSVHTLRSAARVERDPDGKPLLMTGLNWDITTVRENSESLKKSEAKVLLLLNSTGEAIYGIDLKGNCTFANPACARMLGYPDAKMLLGKNMHALIHYAYPDGRLMSIAECMGNQACRDGKPFHSADEVLWKADGTPIPVEFWSHPQIEGEQVIGAVVTFFDITDRKKNEELIRHMASFDSLTDLPLLPLFRDRLAMAINAAIREETQVAVLFLDLDGFKAVNDTYGHDAGDEVLVEMANRFKGAVRATDTVARMGGDEFLFVITGLQTSEYAGVIARKILDSVSQPVIARATTMSIGASIGIALYPGDARTIPELLKKADIAMYDVKKTGKNGFRFFVSLADRSSAS